MFQKNNALSNFSNSLADAAQKAGSATAMVMGRKRMPSSGILYDPDLSVTTIPKNPKIFVRGGITKNF